MKSNPLAAPAECFHTLMLFCPTAFMCHMLFRKSVSPKDIRDVQYLFTRITTDTEVVMNPPVQIAEIVMMPA